MLSVRRSSRRGYWGIGSTSSIPKTWDLTVVTTDVNQTYTIDINTGSNPNITVDWADGVTETFTTTGLKTHTYSTAGRYVVRLSGSFTSGGNIRLGSDATNKHSLTKTSIIPFIKGLVSFQSTFYGCSGLTGPIPVDLFRYNTQVSGHGFYQTFNGCSELTGPIPADLFRYNTQVSSNGFYQTFYGCTNLTESIPADLFRYNTQVSVAGFQSTFSGCTNLSLSSNIFGPPEEYGTRFLNKVSDFKYCFYNTGKTSPQGTAPPLWLYDFGTGTPVKTGCFLGQTSSTVTNFADIPANWK